MIEDFFRELVDEALDKKVSEDVRVYVVGVLVQAPQPSDEPVCMKVMGNRMPRLLVLKEAGDEALFISGFFPEWMRKRGLERRYYASLGSTAYGELAGRGVGSFFMEMARKFDLLQDALEEVRGSCRMGPYDIQAALDEWLRTRTGASERRLARLGLVVGKGEADGTSSLSIRKDGARSI